MASAAGPQRLIVLPGELAVVRLAPGAGPPAPGRPGGAVGVVLRSPGELTLVCSADAVPADAVEVSGGWRALTVAGPFAPAGVVGVLAALAEPLAAAGVSVLALASFDTDHLLVPASSLADAVG